jgi:hypothetical protein
MSASTITTALLTSASCITSPAAVTCTTQITRRRRAILRIKGPQAQRLRQGDHHASSSPAASWIRRSHSTNLERNGFEVHGSETWREHYHATGNLRERAAAANREEAERESGRQTQAWLLYFRSRPRRRRATLASTSDAGVQASDGPRACDDAARTDADKPLRLPTEQLWRAAPRAETPQVQDGRDAEAWWLVRSRNKTAE